MWTREDKGKGIPGGGGGGGWLTENVEKKARWQIS